MAQDSKYKKSEKPPKKIKKPEGRLGVLMPGMGAGTPLHSLSYLLPGIMLDMLYRLSGGRSQVLFLAAIIGGLAYMSIPLSRLILHLISGYPYMAFVKFGALYTTLSFFFFGLLGGALGYGLSSIKSSMNKSNEKN